MKGGDDKWHIVGNVVQAVAVAWAAVVATGVVGALLSLGVVVYALLQ